MPVPHAVSSATAPSFALPAAPTARRRLGRRTLVAALVYVASWVLGLLVPPAAPAATASAGEIHAYYSAHGAAILLQASLVHGLAGVALLVLAVAIPRIGGGGTGAAAFAVVSGTLAGVLSLVQVVLAVVAVSVAQVVPPSTSAGYLTAINLTDAAKIAALAAFIAAATMSAFRSRLLPTWVVVLAAVTVPALVVGGSAFLIASAVLDAVLAASLVLLLTWAAAVGAAIAWRTR